MSEDRDTSIRRMKMRSMRRGIKEMDLILQSYAETHLETLSDDMLSLYDQMLSENDHDLYAWVTQSAATPDAYSVLIDKIRDSYPGA